ncbi:MAG: polysaccharide biosynthesis/export family protein [Nitrospirota bacterium]
MKQKVYTVFWVYIVFWVVKLNELYRRNGLHCPNPPESPHTPLWKRGEGGDFKGGMGGLLLYTLCLMLFAFWGCATTADVKESLEVQEVPVITGIDIQNYEAKVTANKPFNYTFKSIDPQRVVVELPDMSIGAFNSKIISNKAGIIEILPSQVESPYRMARLDIMVETPTIVTPEYKSNTLTIKLKKLQGAVQQVDTGEGETYPIGDEDVLQISVWETPELTVQVPVRPDGMISVPLAGDVKAAGLTPKELKALLEKELSNYIKAPTVNVVVTAVNSFKVYIIGEGTSRTGATGTISGAITLRRNTTLLQLLSQLGSLQNADLNNSFIIRNGQKLNVDFYKLVAKGDISEDIQLRPNDEIFLPDNFEKRIMVVGAVRTPSVIPYREGMTVLDAILSAGGFTEFANPNDVIVARKEGNEIKNIEVRLKDVIKKGEIDKDMPLKPGDRIIVKTGIF